MAVPIEEKEYPEIQLNLSEEYTDAIADVISEGLGVKNVTRRQFVKGGFINNAALYDTDQGPYFVKYSNRDTAHELFESEMISLELIQETGVVKVPKPYKVLNHPQGGAMHVMEYLDGLQPVKTKWSELGERLAKMHQSNPNLIKIWKKNENNIHYKGPKPVEKFGNNVKSFFGPDIWIPEDTWCDSWAELYARHIIGVLYEKVEKLFGDREMAELWSRMKLVLHKPFEGITIEPSLLHGDLCSINVGEYKDEAIMYDPCSLYGHNQFDFNETIYFENSFEMPFFNRYHDLFPKQNGHEIRELLYMTYFHLILQAYLTSNDHHLVKAKKFAKAFLEKMT